MAHRAARRFGVALVAREHVGQTLLFDQHFNRLGQPVKQIGGRRVGEVAALVGGDHFVPAPECLEALRGLGGRHCFFRHGVERQTGRQHQSFLRAADGDIRAPLVVLVLNRAEPRNRIDQQQCRMPGAVDGLANFGNPRSAAGRGFVVHHAHRLDRVAGVPLQTRFDFFRHCRAAPVAFNELGLETHLGSNVFPQCGEVAGLVHQHRVAGRQRIDQRRFPRTGAGRRIDDDVRAGLKNLLHAL